MNCCNHNTNNHNENGQKHHKGHMSQRWMMVLCCGAPLILLLIISLLGASFPGIKVASIGVLPFICPIMMIGMIPMMFMHGNNHDDCHEKRQKDTILEDNQAEDKRFN